MSMSKDDCLHDCTCAETKLDSGLIAGMAPSWSLWCALPEGHSLPHWDPRHGFWQSPDKG